MSSLRSTDLSLIDEIFRGGEKGYILDLSNTTFSDFFVRELNINIDAPEYSTAGFSKGKRLRCLLGLVDDGTAASVLRALWDHRKAMRLADATDPLPRAAHQVARLVAKLEGNTPPLQVNVIVPTTIGIFNFSQFRDQLSTIRDLDPQRRGYDFERFLTSLFNAFLLKAREPFRLVGEQIDGSFEFANETYLMEAKWLNRKVGVAELHTFHGKVEQKASWARGLFISFDGFTTAGLHAFGRGKRVIGVDGRDLYEILGHRIGLDQLLASKVRHAAEIGEVFVSVEALVQTGRLKTSYDIY